MSDPATRRPFHQHPASGHWPHRLLRLLATVPLAIWVFLESGCAGQRAGLHALAGQVAADPLVETRVAKLPPYAALIVFTAVPGLILLPFKFAALYLIAHGHQMYGVAVFIVAKLIGTAFLARIFR